MKGQDGRERHLLDYLAERCGCAYFSDLRRREKAPRAGLVAIVEGLSPEDAPLTEWNATLNYLFGAPLELSAERAKEQLLARLKDSRKGGMIHW